MAARLLEPTKRTESRCQRVGGILHDPAPENQAGEVILPHRTDVFSSGTQLDGKTAMLSPSKPKWVSIQKRWSPSAWVNSWPVTKTILPPRPVATSIGMSLSTVPRLPVRCVAQGHGRRERCPVTLQGVGDRSIPRSGAQGENGGGAPGTHGRVRHGGLHASDHCGSVTFMLSGNVQRVVTIEKKRGPLHAGLFSLAVSEKPIICSRTNLEGY